MAIGTNSCDACTGITRDFPLNSRLRYAAYSLGVDGNISGQAAAALP